MIAANNEAWRRKTNSKSSTCFAIVHRIKGTEENTAFISLLQDSRITNPVHQGSTAGRVHRDMNPRVECCRSVELLLNFDIL
jgi:hypothetical protein